MERREVRRALYQQLDAGAWEGPGLSPVNRFIATTIILAVVLSILETEPAVVSPAASYFAVVDIIFGALFTVE